MTITTHKVYKVEKGEKTPTGLSIWEYYPPITCSPDETINIKAIDEETVQVTKKSKLGEKT